MISFSRDKKDDRQQLIAKAHKPSFFILSLDEGVHFTGVTSNS
jgi:hypothetical protein